MRELRSLIQIDQLVGAHQTVRVRMRPRLDPRAPPARADLEAGAVLGKGIGAIFILVDEDDGDQELGLTVLGVIRVADVA